jgi:hypothetical protein
LFAGAPEDEIGGKRIQGSAYVFARSGAAWSATETHRSDSAASEVFGLALAYDGALLIGCRFAKVSGINQRGAVYVLNHPRQITTCGILNAEINGRKLIVAARTLNRL